jgi:hypothetical protein
MRARGGGGSCAAEFVWGVRLRRATADGSKGLTAEDAKNAELGKAKPYRGLTRMSADLNYSGGERIGVGSAAAKP